MGIKTLPYSPLRRKLLFWFLLLSIIPLIIVGAMAYFSARSALQKEIGEQLQATARNTIQSIDHIIFERMVDVRTLAPSPTIKFALENNKKEELIHFLNQQTLDHRFYDLFLVFDKQGRLLATNTIDRLGRPIPARVLFMIQGHNFREEAWFKRAPVQGLVVEDWDISPIGDAIYRNGGYGLNIAGPVISTSQSYSLAGLTRKLLSKPIPGAGQPRIIGFLLARLSWQPFQRAIENVHSNFLQSGMGSNCVFLTKADGDRVIGDAERELAGKSLKRDGVSIDSSKALADTFGLLRYSRGGLAKTAAYAGSVGFEDFKGLGWKLFIEADEEEIFARIRTIRYWFAGIMLLVGGVIVVTTIRVGRSIAKPILTITKASKAIAEGQFGERVRVPSRDEIGELAENFNQMARSLGEFKRQAEEHHQTLENRVEQRTRELEKSEERYRTLYDFSLNLGSILDFQDVLGVILDRICRFINAQAGFIVSVDPEGQTNIVARTSTLDEKVEELKERVMSASAFQATLKDGKTVIYPKGLSELDMYITGKKINSLIAVPLVCKSEVMGMLCIFNKEGEEDFTADDKAFLDGLASPLAMSLENARLYEELHRAFEEIKSTQDQLVASEKFKALGQMASGIAHDFNNVIMSILGNAQVLLLQIDEPGLRERLKAIEKGARAASDTIKRLQEFTRIRKDEDFVPININELIQDVVQLTRPNWKEKPLMEGINIDLETELGEIGPVMGNPSALKDVFTNLIFNAVDAMTTGGKITIRTGIHNERVEICFADTGCGLSEEIREKIFDPFFTTKGKKGMGLGLSVSYGTITRHGGEIEVESEEGRGTEFILHFPIAKLKGEAKADVSADFSMKQADILIVDDDEEVLTVLDKLLGSAGHRVVTATNGESGIELFQKGRFDLLMTDLGMPGMSGRVLTKKIKALRPDIPTIMITGWGAQFDTETLKDDGVDFLVTKPFDYEKIMRVIQDALAN
jgi:signal transduction histidine kinase/CheY-like chemotaxis protein/HAMP domain-containing protein